MGFYKCDVCDCDIHTSKLPARHCEQRQVKSNRPLDKEMSPCPECGKPSWHHPCDPCYLKEIDVVSCEKNSEYCVDEMICSVHNTDAVNPSHYKSSKIEAIDVIEDWDLDFRLGNALKYIARAGKKDPSKLKEDLEKAIWYIERFINKECKKD